jgi:hypothetical protein
MSLRSKIEEDHLAGIGFIGILHGDRHDAIMNVNAIRDGTVRRDVDRGERYGVGWIADLEHIDPGRLRVDDEKPLGFAIVRDDFCSALIENSRGVSSDLFKLDARLRQCRGCGYRRGEKRSGQTDAQQYPSRCGNSFHHHHRAFSLRIGYEKL